METMLERLQGIRDFLDDLDTAGADGVTPGRVSKLADAVYDLCRDFDARLTEIERKIEAVEMYQREQAN